VLPARGDRLLPREIVGWALDVRCRAQEASAVIDAAVVDRGVAAGTPTLGSDHGTACTSRAFRAGLAEHDLTHRRGGYRDPSPRPSSSRAAQAQAAPHLARRVRDPR
jgi:putative transposase